MKKTERLVFFYDLSIDAESRTFEAPKPISVREAFKLIERVPVEERIKSISNGHEQLYISDLELADDTISILINKSDKRIPPPIFSDPTRNTRRIVEVQEHEGQDFSAHVIIRLPQDDLYPAIALLEHCIGLGTPIVIKLLNEVLKKAKSHSPQSFEQIHPDGSIDNTGRPKMYSTNFKFKLEGHISDELKNDLNNGKIQSIELITEKNKHQCFDEDSYLEEKCKSITLTLKSESNPIADKFSLIANALGRKKDEYNLARIKFKTPTGIDRAVKFEINHIFDQHYVKKEKLDNFESELKSSYDKFCDAILEKMKALLMTEA